MEDHICPYCQGKGVEAEDCAHYYQCTICAGTGYLTSDEYKYHLEGLYE